MRHKPPRGLFRLTKRKAARKKTPGKRTRFRVRYPQGCQISCHQFADGIFLFSLSRITIKEIIKHTIAPAQVMG